MAHPIKVTTSTPESDKVADGSNFVPLHIAQKLEQERNILKKRALSDPLLEITLRDIIKERDEALSKLAKCQRAIKEWLSMHDSQLPRMREAMPDSIRLVMVCEKAEFARKILNSTK